MHPCDREDNAGCQEICKKTDGENYECACPKGFELDPDKHTCKKSKKI